MTYDTKSERIQNITFEFINEIRECPERVEHDPIYGIILEGILSIIVSALGLVGNLITIYILSRSCFKDVFHRLLTALAIFDSCFLGE